MHRGNSPARSSYLLNIERNVEEKEERQEVSKPIDSINDATPLLQEEEEEEEDMPSLSPTTLKRVRFSNDTKLGDDDIAVATAVAAAAAADEEAQKQKKNQGRSERLVSLDAFRGITIAFMILANESYGSYPIIDHAPWDGVHIADFVMPFFLFIVGVSIVLALTRMREQGASRADLLKKAVVRTLKLFFLGVFLQGAPLGRYDLSTLRIPGVLQRIAFGYFVGCLAVLFIPEIRGLARNIGIVCERAKSPGEDHGPRNALMNIAQILIGEQGHLLVFVQYIGHWMLAASILIVYLGLTFGLYVPGCGRGHLTTDCNAAAYIDHVILTTKHMYQWPTCLEAVPPCPYFDPEGILTTFGSSLSCFFGIYYGLTIKHITSPRRRLAHWTPLSLVLLALGLIINYTAVPFNKNLYSISYILLMAGASGLFLSLCYVLVDLVPFLALSSSSRVPRYLSWIKYPFTPFIWLGMNSIAIYAGDMLVWDIIGQRGGASWIYWKEPTHNLPNWIYQHVYAWNGMPEELAALFYALTDILIWIVVAGILYKKRIFYKI